MEPVLVRSQLEYDEQADADLSPLSSRERARACPVLDTGGEGELQYQNHVDTVLEPVCRPNERGMLEIPRRSGLGLRMDGDHNARHLMV